VNEIRKYLDVYLDLSNEKRPHQGRKAKGSILLQAFTDGLKN